MSLERVERILRAALPIEKIIVGRVEGDTSGGFQCQRSPGLRDPELRLEGPAVGTKVHELLGVVLAEGKPHLQAGAHNEVLLVAREFLQRQRGGPVEVYRKTQPRIDKARYLALSLLSCHISAAREPGIGQHYVDLAGLAPHIQHTGVGEEGAMDLEVGVFYWYRGISRHTA